MKWTKNFRASGLLEWVCSHGVGHPDGNVVKELNKRYKSTAWGVHGCDGCCSRDDFPSNKR